MIQIEERDYFALLDKIGFLESKIDGLEGYSKALLDRNLILKNKLSRLATQEIKVESKTELKDFATFKKSKKKYVEFIADSINSYYNTYRERPKVIVMSDALFDILSGGYVDEEMATFADIKVVVYRSEELNFYFVKETYNFENIK